MNKAFVKDDGDGGPPDDLLPPRPSEPLPITSRGFAELKEEHASLLKSGGKDTRRAKLLARVLESVAVNPRARENGGVGFGCFVTVELEDGSRRRYELVGPDESKPEQGRVSIASPLARALLRQKEGATITFRKPNSEEELTILEISCAEES